MTEPTSAAATPVSLRQRLLAQFTVDNLAFLVSLALFGWLLHYFWTGAGGPTRLAVRLLPLCLILYFLRAYQRGGPYERLGKAFNTMVVALYIAVSLVALVYVEREFDDLLFIRAGNFNTTDVAVATAVFLLIMEVSRQQHRVLFYANVGLVLYTLFGSYVIIDWFWHPGTTFERIVTSSSVELARGVYGEYTQLALTLIAAFLLLAAVARGFGAQSAVIRSIHRVAGSTIRRIPFVSVLSSFGIGMVSGSGAANTSVTGAFTIPLMKRHGVPGVYAGGVETAGSIGGLIMPPLMAVAGFIMAEFLGVPYWEVALRGFAIGGVYFVALMVGVYLISIRTLPQGRADPPPLDPVEKLNAGAFFSSIVALIVLLGVLGIGTMRSALYAAIFLFGLLLVIFLYGKFIRRTELVQENSLLGNLRKVVEVHADLTWYLATLLAVLGIMIGLFTITGFLLRLGQLMLQLGDTSLLLTILVAFAFGWLAGTGLPPTATYVVVAVVIVPPFVQLGIDPWVAHFFAFLLAVWGELSPPTSLAAAVAARIAETSFMRTMLQALKICIPIVLMTFAIFVRSSAVTEAGVAQLTDTALLAAGSAAAVCATFGRFLRRAPLDALVRLGVFGVGCVALFHPETTIAAVAAIVTVGLVVLGMVRSRAVPLQGAEPAAVTGEGA